MEAPRRRFAVLVLEDGSTVVFGSGEEALESGLPAVAAFNVDVDDQQVVIWSMERAAGPAGKDIPRMWTLMVPSRNLVENITPLAPIRIILDKATAEDVVAAVVAAVAAAADVDEDAYAAIWSAEQFSRFPHIETPPGLNKKVNATIRYKDKTITVQGAGPALIEIHDKGKHVYIPVVLGQHLASSYPTLQLETENAYAPGIVVETRQPLPPEDKQELKHVATRPAVLAYTPHYPAYIIS